MIDEASRIDDVTIAIDANSNKLDKQVLDPQCCVCHLVGVVVEPSFYLCHVVSYRFVHTLRLCPPHLHVADTSASAALLSTPMQCTTRLFGTPFVFQILSTSSNQKNLGIIKFPAFLLYPCALASLSAALRHCPRV
jgi:hypothetical protein